MQRAAVEAHIRIVALEEVVEALTVQPERCAAQVLSAQVSSARGCNLGLQVKVRMKKGEGACQMPAMEATTASTYPEQITPLEIDGVLWLRVTHVLKHCAGIRRPVLCQHAPKGAAHLTPCWPPGPFLWAGTFS